MIETPEKTYRTLKPIVAVDMPQPSMALGDRAELCLLPLDKLVVDETYQRAIGKQGRPNVLRILANFDWRKFAPVVVTPVGDGMYAIIDGQHRATAALMHPAIDMVPCMIIKVTPAEAAAVFAAINGQVTRITAGQIWKARVVACDPAAIEIDRVMRAAGVQVMAYKTPNNEYRVGDTLAIGTIERMYHKHGANVLTLALQGITQTGGGNPGCVAAALISALCSILKEIDYFQRNPTRFFALMDELNLTKLLVESAATAKLKKRETAEVAREVISRHLASALAGDLKAKAAEMAAPLAITMERREDAA